MARWSVCASLLLLADGDILGAEMADQAIGGIESVVGAPPHRDAGGKADAAGRTTPSGYPIGKAVIAFRVLAHFGKVSEAERVVADQYSAEAIGADRAALFPQPAEKRLCFAGQNHRQDGDFQDAEHAAG